MRPGKTLIHLIISIVTLTVSGEIMRAEQDAAMKDRLELHDQMDEYRRLETEKINMIRKENQKYQRDLEQQIKYQQNLKEKEIASARKELDALHVSLL